MMLEQLHHPADEADKRAAVRAVRKNSPFPAHDVGMALRGELTANDVAKPAKHVHAYRWLCWSLMLLAVGIFAGSDIAANWLEARGRGQAIDPVTATGWVRAGIKTTWYALPLVVLTLLWLVWHFIVGAFHPGYPL